MSIETMKLALDVLEVEYRMYEATDPETGAPYNMIQAITALRQAIEQAQKQEPVDGWTGNTNADAALVMLDRLDVSPDDDDRVDEISKIVRELASPPQRQPEQEPCDMGDLCIGCSPRNADGSCPDAQKQEPVAWRGYNWGHSPDDWVYRDFDDPILDGNGNNVGQPLYTTPPQRQSEQEPVRIMGFNCVCGRRMEVSAEQGVVPAPPRPKDIEQQFIDDWNAGKVRRVFDGAKPWVGLTDEEILSIMHYSQLDNARAIEAKLKQKNGYAEEKNT